MPETDSGEALLAELARHNVAVAAMLLAGGTVDQTLQQIVDLAVQAIDGCDEAGLCEPGLAAGHTVPTSKRVADLDELQTALHEGPCIDVLSGEDRVYVHDVADSAVWPTFGPHAVAAGIRSALAYRLFAGDESFGALQLYARLPGDFNATDRAQGLIFAGHAGVALSLAKQREAEGRHADNLQLALVYREVIGQAQGILMQRERITAPQAFDLLRKASMNLNVKLRDVAQQLVDTGTVLGSEPT